ncbi:Bacteroides conjugative transposon TraK protein [Pedobacter steynii]|uniref:Bacteroides conjugative transposon TraK protein n=1 Tax=Pedobacter steynii TaxID=430522 RepID=A0A1H0G5K9_9SPHI|nr:conjugative transposon protein TraK [Pedobacter steynii]NQX42330.1 conjugative transposon protein TraK [Pedobacter steynii]SDO02187.1 Bacteroides conjugative transposon TraK protein [Pedobacter steynii]
MFKQLKNIDSAFQHIKKFSIFFLLANVVTICFGIYKFCEVIRQERQTVHILYNGKVLEAFASDKKSNLEVELRDHIKTFHQYFFNLSPDDKAIKASMAKALYLADQSAKKAFDNLKEQGYYNNLISANISQEITIDSTRLNINQYPYTFICYATQKLVRASSTVLRRLVTQGTVRDLNIQTDNNPHGFLIQNWETVLNADLNPKAHEPI